ncbi:unnamed protein product [Periconia digitata]|uniref:Uncharacterized protein n=1 Tax=Periconia digitata TaxID=1303443 RepID=A0A9W4XUK4_9PLEO|nr:unnamed protein product [Periconia digitata]
MVLSRILVLFRGTLFRLNRGRVVLPEGHGNPTAGIIVVQTLASNLRGSLTLVLLVTSHFFLLTVLANPATDLVLYRTLLLIFLRPRNILW